MEEKMEHELETAQYREFIKPNFSYYKTLLLSRDYNRDPKSKTDS